MVEIELITQDNNEGYQYTEVDDDEDGGFIRDR